jgi:polar amino acid transport system substrate-binding protein
MHSFSPQKRFRPLFRATVFLGAALALMMVFAACGNSTPTTTTTQKAAITAPTDLIAAGTLTVGSDTTYPPQEFVDTATGQAKGFDIDLITKMAASMGLKVNIVKADFSTIIDSLNAKRYDVVISAMTINSDRQKQVDFVPYFSAGESLLVPKGNPKHLTSINDACGLKIGVQTGTVEQDDANAASSACTKAGKPAIAITPLQDQTAVVQLLAQGRVDATYQDSPVTDYYNSLNPGQFEVGGSVVNAAPEGIAVRKNDKSMFDAIQASFNLMKSNGTYNSLFSQWHLSDSQKVSDVRPNRDVA